jgi:hypothetical protein
VDTTTEEIVEKMLLKFTSGNDVEVTRASFTRDEIDTLIFCVSRWYASAQAYREETEELREVKKNLTAENERLREALRPFAELTVEGIDSTKAGYPMLAKRVMDAREALAGGE